MKKLHKVGRILNAFRNSLSPKTMEALVCS